MKDGLKIEKEEAKKIKALNEFKNIAIFCLIPYFFNCLEKYNSKIIPTI